MNIWFIFYDFVKVLLAFSKGRDRWALWWILYVPLLNSSDDEGICYIWKLILLALLFRLILHSRIIIFFPKEYSNKSIKTLMPFLHETYLIIHLYLFIYKSCTRTLNRNKLFTRYLLLWNRDLLCNCFYFYASFFVRSFYHGFLCLLYTSYIKIQSLRWTTYFPSKCWFKGEPLNSISGISLLENVTKTHWKRNRCCRFYR